MILTGTVRNIADFGAFIDINVHQDGLVHISEISSKYIKHPSEILSINDIVKVKVISVDVFNKVYKVLCNSGEIIVVDKKNDSKK